MYALSIILLFVSKNTLILLGITNVEDNRQITRILPIVFLLILSIPFFIKRININKIHSHLFIIVLLTFICLFNKLTNRDIDISMYLNALILPILLSIILVGVFNEDEKIRIKIRNLILIFYTIECVIAIIERVLNYNILPFALDEQSYTIIDDLSIFRSSSIYGHALANSLVVLTIWSFILFSNMHRSNKSRLIVLGILALISFNSRFSIAFSLLILFAYITYLIVSNKTPKIYKIRLLLLIPLALLSLIFIFFSLGWGGRLVEMGIYDTESAAVRTNLFVIFDYFNISNFVFGVSSEEVDFIKLYSGIASLKIENFWLIFLFRFGFLFLMLLTLSFIPIFKIMFKGYKKNLAIILSIIFIITASTNNSIDTGDPFISIFFICAFAFNQKSQKNVKL